VEQQKLLWAFCHGSTTQAIKNLESFFQLVKQLKLLWAFSLRSTAETIQNVEGFLTTCRTPKTSLNIFSQINSASNKKFGKLFTNLRNNKKFSGQFFFR
jgi:hypothetical protein